MFKKILATIFVFSLFFQTTPLYFSVASADSNEEQLKKELERIEREQAEIQKNLNAQKNQTNGLQKDVNVLSGQIQNAQLNIQKKNLEINKLGQTINLKEQTINQLVEKLERSKIQLGDLVRESHSISKTSLPELLLSGKDLTEFFSQIDSYYKIQVSLEKLFDDIREIKGVAEAEKIDLEKQKNAEVDAKFVIETEKKKVAAKQEEKKVLLNVSKAQESEYERILAEKRAKAETIRAALFQLRDSQGIAFGDALKYARMAEKSTGVRAAFILGILKQETDLGKNVGTCNRAGDPPEKKWDKIMPGPNDGDRSYRDDQTIFLRIVKNLGLDPDTTPLSCPWGTGWGGAMGPSQFIPTTWAAYEPRIANAVGVKTPNPWIPYHAITATAIYMQDLGAAGGGYTAERTAALKYYAGGNWSLPQNAFYGNSVMAHAQGFQENIDFLDDVEK